VDFSFLGNPEVIKLGAAVLGLGASALPQKTAFGAIVFSKLLLFG
jgi:hypothetical protein